MNPSLPEIIIHCVHVLHIELHNTTEDEMRRFVDDVYKALKPNTAFLSWEGLFSLGFVKVFVS